MPSNLTASTTSSTITPLLLRHQVQMVDRAISYILNMVNFFDFDLENLIRGSIVSRRWG